MFYAAINTYGSESSTGFANTWNVLAFHDKQSRDAFVNATNRQDIRAITRKDIPRYVEQPKPFSGHRRVLLPPDRMFLYKYADTPGIAGQICVDWPENGLDW